MRTSLLGGLAVAAALAAGAACNKTNPNYCDEQTPCANGGMCDLVDHSCSMVDAAGPACETSNDCVDEQGLPFCDTAAHACRQCGPGGPSACGGTTPICEDFTCVGCSDDPDCPGSEVCLADGSCAAESNVLYAAFPGAGTTCDKLNPCPIQVAVDAVMAMNRHVIKLAPDTYLLDPAVQVNTDVTIVGRGATLRRNSGNGPVLTSDASTIELDFMTIENGISPSTGDGVLCTNAGTVTLVKVTVQNNDRYAVNSDTCTVVIDQSTIGPNVGTASAGVKSVNGNLTLSRSTVTRNSLGGVWVQGGRFSITNNFIVDANGDGTSVIGGVKIDSVLTGTGPRELSFNTITNNNTSGAASGVVCVSNGATMTFTNNLIYDNDTLTDVANDSDHCTFSYSLVEQGDPGTAATGNVTGVPPVIGGGNYHLSGTWAGVGAADPASTVTVDFDGDVRPAPAGGNADIGADEIP